jgi:glycosyltransferase involved in cell wall biosynthesis
VLTHNLARAMAEKHEVHVFYPRYLEGANECYLKSYIDQKIKIHELIMAEKRLDWFRRLLRFELPGLPSNDERVRRKFEECLEIIKPDIVHFQHLSGLSIDLPIVAKRHCGVIIGLMDYWPICFMTHFLNSNGEICNQPSPKNCWNCLSAEWCYFASKHVRVRPQRLITHLFLKLYQSYGTKRIADKSVCLKQTVKSADKLIVSSKTLIRKFVENGFINADNLDDGKVALISHGVDTHALTKVEKKPYKRTRFGYIGTFSERKGVNILIEAFNKLGDINAELKIYGGTNLDTWRAKDLIEKAKNNTKIHFMGPFKDIREPYSGIDVLVVPSITFEGFGLVVQEAFATKTPVIASNIGALNEFVEHMKNGLLFEVGNSHDLARNMRKIVENIALLRHFESNIPPVKSVEQNAKEIEAVYEEVRYRDRI